MISKANLLQWGGRLGLMAMGLGVAGLMVWLLLTLFPNLLPASLRNPLDQRRANQSLEVRYYDTDGDLFFHLKGQVKPPDHPTLLSVHPLRTDQNGFRLPAIQRDSYADYPIVVLGDSFTEAWMVAEPWPDVLARESDKPTLNLSFRGYGPVEYVEMMREFGGDSHEWVLVGYFEGNDLQNIHSSLNQRDGNLLTGLVREAVQPDSFEIVESPDGNYRYPLALYIGANFYELAFYDSYIWVLNGRRAVYDESRNLAELEKNLRAIQELAGDACVGLVYMPTKAHIYFRYAEPHGRRWILEQGSSTVLDDTGWMAIGPTVAVEFEDLLAEMNNQRDTVQQTAAALNITFIDLTPAFEEYAAAGEMLYLTYDTHWNSAGQALAGRTVADALRQPNACKPEG